MSVDPEIRAAEERGRDGARLLNLETHAKSVNGSLERMTGQITAFRTESARENKELRESISKVKESISNITAEKKSIISLQNRQVAFMAAVGTIVFLILEHAHP